MALMYGPTDRLLARAALSTLEPVKADGPNHNPVPFADFVDMIHVEMKEMGLDVISEEYVVTANAKRLFGAIHIVVHGDAEKRDWNVILGVRGAHDHRFARALTLGSHVTVCSNLCFHGDLGLWKTKQTTFIMDRLPSLIRRALNEVPRAVESQGAIFDMYKSHTLEHKEGDAILLDLYRKKALSTPQLARSINEWDKPTHDYGSNVYTLFNSCTEAMKPTGRTFSPELHMARTRLLTHELDEVVGI